MGNAEVIQETFGALSRGPQTAFAEITGRAALNNKDHTFPKRTSEAYAGGKAISRNESVAIPSVNTTPLGRTNPH